MAEKQIPMTSAKGVILYTEGKLCEEDIVVTPELEEVTITENGEYTSSKVGYGKVSVNVETAEDLDAELTEQEDLIAELKDTLLNGVGDEIPADKYFEGGYAEVDLPNATKIKQYAFYLDETIESIGAPNAENIGNNAFSNCTKLESMEMPKVTSVGNYAFQYCSVLRLTALPSGITSVGNYAFKNCFDLALTSLPSDLKTIGNYAFSYCQKILISEIPSGVNNIGTRAFERCNAITSITFKGTPTSFIQTTAFADCTNLKTINVPWAEGEVSGAPWGATNATINYNYTG